MANDGQAPDKDEKSVSIRFPVTLLMRLRQVAESDKRSLNSEVVWIVTQYIEQWLQSKEKECDDG